MKTVLTGLMLAGLWLAAPHAALADEDGDHDRVRELYEHGDIRALSTIIHEVNKRLPGDVVAVDLVRGKDGWLYRLQIVDANGNRSIVTVDADSDTEGPDEDDQ